MSLGTTPSQTVGPFLHIGLTWADGPDVVAPGAPGEIFIGGYLYDGAGDPIPDGMIETWQADPAGHFNHPEDAAGSQFRGFARYNTDPDGGWRIRTLKPGRVDADQAPHIDVSVFARGLLHRLVTRIYFGDEDNSRDPVLSAVDSTRWPTLIAVPIDNDYRFDIHLQGDQETVFFEV